MDGWNTLVSFLLGWKAYFQVRLLLVSGKVVLQLSSYINHELHCHATCPIFRGGGVTPGCFREASEFLKVLDLNYLSKFRIQWKMWECEHTVIPPILVMIFYTLVSPGLLSPEYVCFFFLGGGGWHIPVTPLRRGESSLRMHKVGRDTWSMIGGVSCSHLSSNLETEMYYLILTIDYSSISIYIIIIYIYRLI